MKKALIFLVTAVMLLSCFTTFTLGATAVTYEINPTVFVGGPIYNVIWKTNVTGVGYVEYVLDGKTYRVYDEEGGIVRADDDMHTVAIPMEHLDKAGSYTVTTIGVTSQNGRNVTYGEKASVTRSFRGYQGQKEINMWSLSDVHGIGMKSDHSDNFGAVDDATALLKPNPDLVTLLGDMVTVVSEEYTVDYIFELADHLTNGEIPVIYSRGNHETRGRFSGVVARYITTPDVEFCFDFDYGPISFIVMDYGEDKLDSQIEYNGTVDYENFRINITNWLANMGGYTEDAQYRVAMCHGADGINHFGHNWIEILSAYGTDIQISGHHHGETYKFWYPKNYDQSSGQWNASGYQSSYCIDFPIYITGVHDNNTTYKCSNIIFKDGKIKVYGQNPANQEEIIDKTITAGMNIKDGTSIKPLEKKPSTESMLEFAGKTQVSSDFSYITKPAVFDTGDSYTVMWAVTEGTSSTGTVWVEKDGVRYRFTDNMAGALSYNSNRVGYPAATSGDKNIHAVSIPKKYLDNATYEVVTRHIINTSYYTGMVRGSEISTGVLQFDAYDKATDTEIEMLYLSDWDFARDVATYAKPLGKDADVIVSGGNMLTHIETDTDFTQYIKTMGALTGGKKPIIFVRGENETVGSYAYYLKELFKTTTRDMFNKITFGPISAVVLDTSAVYEDNDSRYNGLAAFELVRQAQLEWLKETDLEGAQYKLAFSSAPELYDVFGYDYSKYLNSMGVDLAVFGHSESAQFTEAGTRALNYACAYNAVDDWTLATRLTFKGGNITVEAINMDGDSKLTNSLSVDDNKANAFTDISANDWYAEAVNYVRTQNLMMGTSDTTFSPDEKVTRGMAAVVLAQTCNADLTQKYEHPFTDVDKDAYYNNAIGWCYQNGVTAGTSDKTHSPEDVLTREQLCTMLVHVYGDKLESANSADFTDFADVADYAKTSVATLAKAGAVDGVGDGKFAPKLEINRAMLAQILYAAGV